jgi:hypothetical protein
MGLIHTNVLPLLKEHARRPFHGHALCLGYPRSAVTHAEFDLLADIAGVRARTLASEMPHGLPENRSDQLSGVDLLKQIGFEKVSTLDYSRYEGASIQFDLNSPVLPAELQGRFDAVIDHGTIEHVFHIPHVMRNIFGLLGQEGRVFHSSPGHNFFDHGFYMFSPTFFHDYYTGNRWLINSLQVYQMDRDERATPFFADYRPGFFAGQCYGGLDSKMYGTICIATKGPESTADVWPLQHAYATAAGWRDDRKK